MKECTTTPLPFARLRRREIHTDFSGGQITSDAGALLLREADQKLGLIDALDAAIPDPRNPGLITHPQRGLLAQRIFALAAGCEDLNDHQHLRDDPLWQLATEHPEVDGDDKQAEHGFPRLRRTFGGHGGVSRRALRTGRDRCEIPPRVRWKRRSGADPKGSTPDSRVIRIGLLHLLDRRETVDERDHHGGGELLDRGQVVRLAGGQLRRRQGGRRGRDGEGRRGRDGDGRRSRRGLRSRGDRSRGRHRIGHRVRHGRRGHRRLRRGDRPGRRRGRRHDGHLEGCRGGPGRGGAGRGHRHDRGGRRGRLRLAREERGGHRVRRGRRSGGDGYRYELFGGLRGDDGGGGPCVGRRRSDERLADGGAGVLPGQQFHDGLGLGTGGLAFIGRGETGGGVVAGVDLADDGVADVGTDFEGLASEGADLLAGEPGNGGVVFLRVIRIAELGHRLLLILLVVLLLVLALFGLALLDRRRSLFLLLGLVFGVFHHGQARQARGGAVAVGHAAVKGMGGDGADAGGLFVGVAVGVGARDDVAQGDDHLAGAAATLGEGDGGLVADALVAIGAEGGDEGLFGFGPVVAVEGAEVLDGLHPLFGAGAVELGLGGGPDRSGVEEFGDAGDGGTEGRDDAAGERGDGRHESADELARGGAADLAAAELALFLGDAEACPDGVHATGELGAGSDAEAEGRGRCDAVEDRRRPGERAGQGGGCGGAAAEELGVGRPGQDGRRGRGDQQFGGFHRGTPSERAVGNDPVWLVCREASTGRRFAVLPVVPTPRILSRLAGLPILKGISVPADFRVVPVSRIG
ncbi:MAG: transposase [Gemmataceae bacterium]|nr:transposase [Gemmataceae bacterium]